MATNVRQQQVNCDDAPKMQESDISRHGANAFASKLNLCSVTFGLWYKPYSRFNGSSCSALLEIWNAYTCNLEKCAATELHVRHLGSAIAC